MKREDMARKELEPENPVYVGIDVGGTHTDVVAVDDQGRLLWSAKVPSTPSAPIEAVRTALSTVPKPTEIVLCVNGTTIGINAVLQQKLPAVLLIATKGFGDLLYIRRETKQNIYDLDWRKPRPLVPRSRTFEVSERIGADGSVVIPISGLSQMTEWVQAQSNKRVAVCLIHAYKNPEHERAVRDAIVSAVPDARVTLSSDVWPEWREFERTYNTVLNSALSPLMESYISSLIKAVQDIAGHDHVYLMHADGGVLSPGEIVTRPVLTLLSGAVAGALMGARSAAQAGIRSAVSLDMGGTSSDLSLSENGEPRRSSELTIEWEGTLGVAGIDVVSIGAGGGSIIWNDEAGGLHVGPASAGADPGPACLGREGATSPTLTDAYLVLGYLGPKARIADKPLDVELAKRAFQSLCRATGLELESLCQGAYEIANARLAAAVRNVTIERGIDPRGHALICFGGAGPLHAAAMVREVGLQAAIIPPRPGNTSALGLLLAPLKHTASQTFFAALEDLPSREFAQTVLDLQKRATAPLNGSDTAPTTSWIFNLRYRGQTRDLMIPLDDASVRGFDANVRDNLAETFHKRHEQEFTFEARDAEIQLTSLRCEVSVEHKSWPAQFGLPLFSDQEPNMVAGSAEVLLSDRGAQVRTRVTTMDRAGLARGARLDGPAIITDVGSTILVPHGFSASVDNAMNLVLQEADR